MGIRIFFNRIEKVYSKTSTKRFEAYLKRRGIKIGKNIYWGTPKTINIDLTRPCLVEIGNNVRIDTGTTILTHDFGTYVFRLVYDDFVSASAKVSIGNNVYLGQNCTILKGVKIGDNCIIGTGSIVTKDIPANSVAAGVPAKVIYSLDEYYQKRKKACVEEAKAYAREIQQYYGRKPIIDDFWEEFPLFWSQKEDIPTEFYKKIKFQLGPAYDNFIKKNIPLYASFDDFIEDALK
ncbi:acyltransferase [Paludibacter sp. 221]|uniref:acyltransferase n=1 Tax=Paludibacter sp. 221 TaxID=2302939 RepID=UPI0013D5897D|nr:acyltransferase [Paludibacter sp. 221]NDV46033.1 acyltransferase [Paludibacter sp. 221]